MKYRKKPVVIEAFQFYVDNMPDWFMDAVSNDEVILYNCDYKRYTIDEAYCRIHTLEGWRWCNGGDYVIKGIKGELYPCKADIFKQTYEEVKQMTKIEELEQKINEASSGFEFVINEIRKELVSYKTQKELKESKKEGKWKPFHYEEYYVKDVCNDILRFTWCDTDIDNWRYNNIPIFKTKSECERYWHFMDTVKEKSYEFTELDWRRNDDIEKWVIEYNYLTDQLRASDHRYTKRFGLVYFKDKESAQYIIDNFKDELMEFFVKER